MNVLYFEISSVFLVRVMWELKIQPFHSTLPINFIRLSTLQYFHSFFLYCNIILQHRWWKLLMYYHSFRSNKKCMNSFIYVLSIYKATWNNSNFSICIYYVGSTTSFLTSLHNITVGRDILDAPSIQINTFRRHKFLEKCYI